MDFKSLVVSDSYSMRLHDSAKLVTSVIDGADDHVMRDMTKCKGQRSKVKVMRLSNSLTTRDRKRERERSRLHGRINFKLGENFLRRQRNT